MAAGKEATAAANGEKGAAAAEKEVTGGKMITLKSNDEKPFEVSEAAAWLSGLPGKMIESDCTKDSVQLPTIAAATLEKVVEYLNNHAEAADGPHTVAGSNAVRAAADAELKKWDAELVDGLGRQDALFDLILAADHLAIDELLDTACKKIADMMKGKTPEQIRATFNIADDYTEQEKVEMRREYAWAFPKGRSSSSSAAGDDDKEEEDEEEEEEE